MEALRTWRQLVLRGERTGLQVQHDGRTGGHGAGTASKAGPIPGSPAGGGAAYTNAFENIDALEAPTERPEVEHAWHLYVLRLRLGALRIERNQFIDELTARNIGTSVHFIPIHIHPFYQQKYGYQPTQLPVAYESYQRMLSLPLHPMLTDADVSDVISAVLDIVQRFGR